VFEPKFFFSGHGCGSNECLIWS